MGQVRAYHDQTPCGPTDVRIHEQLLHDGPSDLVIKRVALALNDHLFNSQRMLNEGSHTGGSHTGTQLVLGKSYGDAASSGSYKGEASACGSTSCVPVSLPQAPKRLRSGSTIKIVKGPFFAVVSKSKFRMDIFFGAPGGPGSMYVTSFGVGLGKNDSTPTGTWQVQSGNKILHPRYYSPNNAGVIDADDPKNPLGGYWIGLEGLDGQAVDQHSYGIHGTIDPDSIGKQASLGCIRMGHDDIELAFELLVEVKSKIVCRSVRWMRGSIISPSFRGMRDSERQQRVWDVLHAEYGPQSFHRVGTLLVFTPDEWDLSDDSDIE